jgi:hypothetical protein
MDLYHYWGEDLTVGPTGDLLPVDGTTLGQQRVLRRLLTPPSSYVWHPTYGAGLPSYIGTTASVPAIESLIRSQIALEAAVASTPAPVITVTPIPSGVFVRIQYVDADTGTQVNLSFDLDK